MFSATSCRSVATCAFVIPIAVGSAYGPTAATRSSGVDDAILFAGSRIAFVRQKPLLITRAYRVFSSLTLSADLEFTDEGSLVLDAGATVMVNSSIQAPDKAHIFAGLGKVVVISAPRVSVAWWGASATALDSAPAFNAAGGSNRQIVVPPGPYTFCSVRAIPSSDGQAFDPEAVIYRGYINLRFSAYGATMTMCPNVSTSATGSIVFDQIKGLVAEGGVYNGTKVGAPANAENNAIGLVSVQDFVVRDVKCGTGYGGVGACLGGDWMQTGRFENITASGVGIFADVAFLNHVVFDKVHGTGADDAGGTGSSHPGQTGLSFKYDPPNASYNLLNMPITDSSDVTIINSEMTNFQTGNLIGSGKHIRFINDNAYDNPGLGRAAGIGYYITVGISGFAPGDISILGGLIVGNGSTTQGAGVGITAPSRSADTIDGISITGVRCYDNVPFCFAADSIANLRHVEQNENVFGGQKQLCSMNKPFMQALDPIEMVRGEACP